MLARPLKIPDVRLIVPHRVSDSRGWFSETWRRASLRQNDIDVEFIQENESVSTAPGTIRGLHYQEPPMAQAKLVRVTAGAIFDVAIDLRRNSATFLQWVSVSLTAAGGEQLFMPRGFAHGYCTLEPDTRVTYLVDNYYSPDHERGLAFDDRTLGIPWPFDADRAILSEKDRLNPPLDQAIAAL